MPGLDQRAALEWIARWDEQQQEHLPDREDRYTALIDGDHFRGDESACPVVERLGGALRAAGFSEVGTLWRRGNNRILCGVRGG